MRPATEVGERPLSSTAPPESLAPTLGTERFELLDVVRGVALFGIVTANMIGYSRYLNLDMPARQAMATYGPDRILDWLELFLVESKFYTIFSVLFGVGFAVLLTRASAKGLVFHRFYLRRIAILFAIGFAHGALFWDNDILMAYSICGALLLPFVRARDRTILIVAALVYLTPLAIKLAGGVPAGAIRDVQDTLYADFALTRETRIDAWARGSYLDAVHLNLIGLLGQVSYLIKSGMIFRIYGCFLLGSCIGRRELFRNLESARPMLRRMVLWGFVLGLPLNAVMATTFDSGSWLEALSTTFGVVPLSAAYVGCCCLIWLSERGRGRLRHFAAVGRMALTNYVGQSVICAFLFFGIGLGLAGKVGPTLFNPIGFAIYAVQVVASQWWLRRFRFGPLEWLWRVLTYGHWMPIAKRA